MSNAKISPKDAEEMANSADPNQQSDLVLHCLLRHICLFIYLQCFGIHFALEMKQFSFIDDKSENKHVHASQTLHFSNV